MTTQAKMFVLALSAMSAGCSTVSTDVVDGDAATRMAAAETPGMSPAPLAEGASSTRTDDSMPIATTDEADAPGNARAPIVGAGGSLAAGSFVGDLVLDQKRMCVRGAGEGETVIDGDLIVTSQCDVRGMTVTGDVIFTGNNARVVVQCLGQVLDYGVHNRCTDVTRR